MQPNLSETAKDTMSKKGYNCSQAIFATYGGQMGLGTVDYDTCLKISSAFGGGIVRTGNICGALTGALMVIGLKYSGDKGKNQEEVNRVGGQFLNEFKSLNGSIICRELIKHDLISKEDVEHAFKTGAFGNCPKFVKEVSKMLEKLL